METQGNNTALKTRKWGELKSAHNPDWNSDRKKLIKTFKWETFDIIFDLFFLNKAKNSKLERL